MVLVAYKESRKLKKKHVDEEGYAAKEEQMKYDRYHQLFVYGRSLYGNVIVM